ncbi:hypothetical protein Trydic_g18478 [Trypoxylus dichotomus]
MQAIVFNGREKTVRVVEKPIPKISDDRQVLVKVAYAGVCGTDLHIIEELIKIGEGGIFFLLGPSSSQEVQTRTTSFGGSNRKAETVTGEKQRPKNQKTPPAWSDQRQQLIDNHSHCFRTIYFKILASDLIVRKARECISQVTLVHFLSDPIISYDNVNVTIRAVNTKVT